MPSQPDRRSVREPPGSGRPPGPARWGLLRGGAGLGIIAASAAVGAAVTIATRAQPGRVLGVCIVAGTVVAALAVRPRSGRLIFPVPVLSYLIAAFVAGIAYNRSTSKTELVIGATQWIANGFFLMALATIIAIVLVTARWGLARRIRRADAAADQTTRRRPAGRDEAGTNGARGKRRDSTGSRGRTTRPGQGQRPQGPAPGPDPRGRPYADPRAGNLADPRAGNLADPRAGNQADPRSGNQADPRAGNQGDPRSGNQGDPRGGPYVDPRGGSYQGQRNGQRGGPYPAQHNGRYADQRNGPYPEQRNGQRGAPSQGQRNGRPADQPSERPDGQRPGSGPYNFSSGA